MVVSTHSGPSDWGYGPAARGKLYKITYTQPEAPSPVAAWSPAPGQVKIAFDKPLDENDLSSVSGQIVIEYGQYVEAADRFEVLCPGYKAVESKINYHREKLQVKSAYLDRKRVVQGSRV